MLVPKQMCHPDRSVAEWRDLLFSLFPQPLCHPAAQPDGSAVPLASQRKIMGY
jgi:hypothetical protein